jgi:sugar phosphate isomerase/epimerase
VTNPPAVQLYSVREQMKGDRVAVLRRLAAFGYGAVEPYDVRTDPAALRADLDQAGLAACSVHGKVLGDGAGEVLRGARVVGAGTVIVPKAPRERFAGPDAVADLARDLNQAASRAAGHGLRLGYHNEAYEVARQIAGRTALEVLADSLDEAVVLEVDTYWAAAGGQDVPALLRRLGDRVRYLHVKDGPVTLDDPHTAVGQGRMPVAGILAACPSAEWHVVELDECATDMLTAVGDSLAWLVSHGLARQAGSQVARAPGARAAPP